MKTQMYVKAAAAIIAAVALCTATHARAAGDLDPSFGNAGKVTTDFFGGIDGARTVAIQQNGKIVAAGSAFNSNAGDYQFALSRYNTDGKLDSTFGDDGKVVTPISTNTPPPFGVPTINAIAIQSNGKIVAAGVGFNNATATTSFTVLRYDHHGRLDHSFGRGGIVTTGFGGINARANGLVLQPDGKIIVVGTADTVANRDFVLVRYKPNGSLDRSFGNSGKVITDLSLQDSGNAVRLTVEGKILVAGQTFCLESPCGATDFAVLRYNPDGSLDSSFGNGGKVTTDFVALDVITALDVAPDGKIVVAGFADRQCPLGCPKIALTRYNPDGSPDTDFGAEGKVTTQLGFATRVSSMTITSGESGPKIIVGGYYRERQLCGERGIAYPCDFALLRYNWDGSLDASFGSGGKVTTDISGGTQDQAFGLAIDRLGNIILAGNDSNDFALVRYLSDEAQIATRTGQESQDTGEIVNNM